MDAILHQEDFTLQDIEVDWSKIDSKLCSSLMPFQKENVE